MKKPILLIGGVLLSALITAQSIRQNNMPQDETSSLSTADTIALAIGSVALSALIFYLVYIRIAGDGFWARRKSEIARSKQKK